jgi:CarD family transcriptional regulator
MPFKVGDRVVYPHHGAAVIEKKETREAFGEKTEYLVLRMAHGDLMLSVPSSKAEEVGMRPPISAEDVDDLFQLLAKKDVREPTNWSRRFKNHQEKLKSGDVYQVAEVVRNLAARNHEGALSAAERTMYERARINLVSEIAPALKDSAEDAEAFLDDALAKGVLKAPPPPRKKK